MVIRISEVSVVEQPHVSHVENFVIRAGEELVEVLAWLKQI